MKIVSTSLLILLALLAISTASAQNATYYLVPVDSSIPDCTSAELELRINTHGHEIGAGQIGLTYDTSCANVINFVFDPMWSPAPYSDWNPPGWSQCWDGDGIEMDTDWIAYFSLFSGYTGDLLIGTFTINCSDPRGNCDYCITDLTFVCGVNCRECPIDVADMDGEGVPFDCINSTFTCGSGAPPPVETFSKSLSNGWNLISLPLVPGDNSVSAVLSTASCDAVYRYDATSKQFESIEGVDAMDPGTGYFVHATEDCTWEYSGTPYTSTDVSLKQGLNMVGWLNSTKDVGALSSISDCYYVAQWDATAEKFEVYNPAAPVSFNDFTTMERGTGYFISAKQDCTLSESC